MTYIFLNIFYIYINIILFVRKTCFCLYTFMFVNAHDSLKTLKLMKIYRRFVKNSNEY
jgi:hypothetical protein